MLSLRDQSICANDQCATRTMYVHAEKKNGLDARSTELHGMDLLHIWHLTIVLLFVLCFRFLGIYSLDVSKMAFIFCSFNV